MKSTLPSHLLYIPSIDCLSDEQFFHLDLAFQSRPILSYRIWYYFPKCTSAEAKQGNTIATQNEKQTEKPMNAENSNKLYKLICRVIKMKIRKIDYTPAIECKELVVHMLMLAHLLVQLKVL